MSPSLPHSRISQRSRVSSAPDQDADSIAVSGNHRSLRPSTILAGDTCVVAIPPSCEPNTTTEAQHLLTEQHRLQAEYLSQVLYDSLSSASSGLDSAATIVPMMGSHTHGPLGRLAKTRHIRTVTTPVASLVLRSSFAPTSQPPLTVPTASLLPKTECGEHLEAQTMVFLRGGGRDEEFSQLSQKQSAEIAALFLRHANIRAHDSRHLWQADALTGSAFGAAELQDLTKYHHPGREYGWTRDWVELLYSHPAWAIPISTGNCLRDFLLTLSSYTHNMFFALFGYGQPATHYVSSVANTRRDFYGKLDFHRQGLFDHLIGSSAQELLSVIRGGRDPQHFPLRPPLGGIMLYHLLEATERPFYPSPTVFRDTAKLETYLKHSSIPMTAMEPWRAPASKNPRSSSAPNFEQHSEYDGHLTSTIFPASVHNNLT
ncbi:hypothetical protein HBH70_101010 [Parastagonospora nodorum]|nr:hypothetical protein HBH54_233090 [Parastagonospora nodorum]KAH3991848.1 hypothetical protein HBI10_225460 [Parastagonospora nodorum]KAH4009298.1 hypothetical protein HBI13_220150 [Parastagonospora nodorum]KAH4125530.1 hypothetical protein HBH45_229340 [Parastagonospora nodorum]KAH4147937.1 hypothetical protein HBH44_215490 [Parastagonospora nodorum]